MAIAILGGTFDPVHNAHLAMARAALASLPIDKLLFIPTGSPKYRTPASAQAKHRVAMLNLALKGELRLRLDERELQPDATGYTVDTLRALRSELGPKEEIWFLMGADQLARLGSWREPGEVRKLARLAVFARPGYEAKDPEVKVIPMAPMPVSASDIRARAAKGESLAGLVPPEVENYISEHKLYQ